MKGALIKIKHFKISLIVMENLRMQFISPPPKGTGLMGPAE